MTQQYMIQTQEIRSLQRACLIFHVSKLNRVVPPSDTYGTFLNYIIHHPVVLQPRSLNRTELR